jgi:hypothetical protein
MLASVATRDEIKPLVVVLFVAVRLVPLALPNESTVVVAELAKKLVDDANVEVKLVKNPVRPVIKVEKMLVEVANVVDALVATRLVPVAEVKVVDASVVCPDTRRLEIVDEASVDVPVTVRRVIVVVASVDVPPTD